MPSDDVSFSARVGRILDSGRSGGPAPAPDPIDAWPSEWPPGADDRPPDSPSPAGRFGSGSALDRWAVPGRAAVAFGALALVIVGVVLFFTLRGPSSGAGVPVPFTTGSTLFAGSPTPAVPVVAAAPTALGAPAASAAVVAGGVPASAGPSAGLLRVYVVGQVREPSVVSLPPGARVEDAVDAAGGATSGADLTVMNLARKVVDGERIVVPKPGEQVPTPDPAPAPADDGTTTGTTTGSGTAGTPGPGSPVDLNTATAADLDALPGVGPVLAGRIITWRQQNGQFKTVDDLGQVSGIGDAILTRLRPLVTV